MSAVPPGTASTPSADAINPPTGSSSPTSPSSTSCSMVIAEIVLLMLAMRNRSVGSVVSDSSNERTPHAAVCTISPSMLIANDAAESPLPIRRRRRWASVASQPVRGASVVVDRPVVLTSTTVDAAGGDRRLRPAGGDRRRRSVRRDGRIGAPPMYRHGSPSAATRLPDSVELTVHAGDHEARARRASACAARRRRRGSHVSMMTAAAQRTGAPSPFEPACAGTRVASGSCVTDRASARRGPGQFLLEGEHRLEQVAQLARRGPARRPPRIAGRSRSTHSRRPRPT